MGAFSKGILALLKLIAIIAVGIAAVWLAIDFMKQLSLMTLIPVIGVYLAYKVFCITLNIVKLLVKIAVIILIVLLFFI
ncbi:hypothetical protein GGR21_001292 [Dysgonomonas hofstadii]|uniref:Uncharacterized protein n=1 Tax=Dysgonomonas hofstadii TaxID=637886 RepID=A0A840CL62_9BACT|nr:hypothetical protein [Dysgonomonas hofstadii]MBB4035399.1 hypothetical protein [Dysgonomonas hofstadii]